MYIAIFFTLFGIVLYMSIYLANSISKQLYRRERALTIAYEKLEEAEKSKSRYVMSVVHDLKTPIAAVLTYLDMLLEGSKGELKEGQVQPLERSKIRLLNAIGTINDILYISQLKLESTIDKSSNVNLNELFDEIYHDFQVIIHSKNISYEFHSDNNPSIIKGESRILKLALANIISNSVKYSDSDGKISIKITDFRNSFLISIADDGIGIPDAEKRKVFDDFYRTTKSKKRSTEGSGLGLSITLETIRKYSGSIKVESPSYLAVSDDLPGSEFIIELPKE
jgi:signal transduction histidine kinase